MIGRLGRPQVGAPLGQTILDDRSVVGVQSAVFARSLREGDFEHSRQSDQARVVEGLFDPQRGNVVVVEIGVTQVGDASALLSSHSAKLLELHAVSIPRPEQPALERAFTSAGATGHGRRTSHETDAE
jgi:hypothetical protein